MKKIANLILGIGIILTIIGAIYIAVVYHQYAIAGCFGVAAVLMYLMMCSKKEK